MTEESFVRFFNTPNIQPDSLSRRDNLLKKRISLPWSENQLKFKHTSADTPSEVVMSFCNHFLIPILVVLFGCNSKASENGVSGIGIQKVAFSSRRIGVCWENRSKADIELKDLRSEIGQYIKSQFDRTVIQFEGWTDCRDPSGSGNEVRITWWDEGESPGLWVDGASQLGNGALYGPGVKILNQKVESKVRSAPTMAINSVAFRENKQLRGRAVAIADIQTKVLHEFGHAIGLLHEHIREDSTCLKNEKISMHLKYWQQAEGGVPAVTASIIKTKKFDESSIMNYCHLEQYQATGKSVGLSDGDIETINLLYSNAKPDRP
ncbi:MAG: hypothetical protein RIR26_1942 [Pseudomonadota bacterium]